MRSKKLVVLLLAVMGIMALSVVNAGAVWYTCTVNQCGTNSAVYLLVLTDTGATFPGGQSFLLDPTNPRAKEMYAAALTAYSSSGKVQVYIDNTLYPAGTIAGSPPWSIFITGVQVSQ